MSESDPCVIGASVSTDIPAIGNLFAMPRVGTCLWHCFLGEFVCDTAIENLFVSVWLGTCS